MQSIKLVVVTANDLVRNGIQMLMDSSQSIEIAQSFSHLQHCKQFLKNHRANVMLLDDALPGHQVPSQIVATLHDLYPALMIIILSDCLSEFYVQRLLNLGASGFIYKADRLEDTLAASIQTVADGHIFLSPRASALPYGRMTGGQLNRSDLEVLDLMAQGYTVQEIAARVGIVDRSVYRIRARLRQYLDVRTNEQVIDAAFKRGLLHTNRMTTADRN